jgi:hypothetical protein
MAGPSIFTAMSVGCYELELHRTPVDLVEKRIRLIGRLVGPELVIADGVAPA